MLSSTLIWGLDYLGKENIRNLLNRLDHEREIINEFNQQNPIIGPTIYSQPPIYNLSSNLSPFITTDPLIKNRLVSGFYPDLNKDKQVRDTVTKHFYNKLINKWLLNDKTLRNLLSYVNNNADGLIKSLSNLSIPNNDSSDLAIRKISFLQDKIIDKKFIKHILRNMVEKHNINWYHLHKHKDRVKQKIFKYLSSLIEEIINKSKN
jgi:hypothetical protein